jgi:hypothetical protein
MAAYIDASGNTHQVAVGPEVHKKALEANLSVEHFLNREHANADLKIGTAFQQLCASEGLALPGKNPFGLRASTIDEILSGKASAGINTTDAGTPFGSASRTLFPPALLAAIESQLAKDRVTDTVVFDQMVGQNVSVTNENFEQPVINYGTAGGPEQARAQRIAQNATPATVLKFSTADRIRRLPVWSIGMEFSDQALRASTLDMVALMTARFMEVEKDSRVYDYLSSLFLGDNDLNTGAVAAVTSTSLDAAATGGVLTHKAWVKFLARNRKYRKVDFVIGTVGTYLQVEGRTGRPGTTNYDPTLARIDPQASAVNAGFGNDVKWFIVDDYAAGGPVPEGQVWALDSRSAITKVTNAAANYAASENFVMQRSTALRYDWSELCYRTMGNSELRGFDILTIA